MTPDSPEYQALVERAAARYLPAGRWAEGWAKGKMGGDPAYAAVLAGLDAVPPGGTLLELGCGEGYLLVLARQLRPDLRLVGVDHDQARLDLARQALADPPPGTPPCQLLAADLQAAEIVDVDLLVCLDVLHYLPAEAQQAVLRRLADRLAPGGGLVIRDAEAGAGLRSWLTELTEGFMVAIGRHKGMGVFLRTRAEVLDDLQALGLDAHAEDCSEGTPWANVLYRARRQEEA